VGALVAALCCFTPVLVVLLTTIGFSAVVGWLDFVLLPALAMFMAIVTYSLFRLWRANAQDEGRSNHG
jgi:mercuric ion transport protein